MALLGHVVSEETKQRIAATLRGRKASDETKQRMSESLRGHVVSAETRMHISESLRNAMTSEVCAQISKTLMGHEVSEVTRQRISESCLASVTEEKRLRLSASLMGNTNALGHTLSEEAKQIIGKASSRANLGKTMSEESKQRMSESRKAQWKDPEYQKHQAESCHQKPNESELRLQAILDRYQPGKWKFVGDSQFWIGNRNPDFLNVDGEKQVIEMFGAFWHDPTWFPNRPSEEELIAHYREYGFSCIVFQEYEVYCDEKLVVEKVKSLQ